MTAIAEYQTNTKTGITRDLAASAYWRELRRDKNMKRASGLRAFLKEEWHASGYYNSAKKRNLYPV